MSIELTSNPAFVKYVQSWGGDSIVGLAAMVADPDEEAITPEHTAKLLDTLGAEGHWGCWEHSGMTFYIEVPIATARQVLRHRTGAYNEFSLRYKKMLPRFYIPEMIFTDVKRSELGGKPEPHPFSDFVKESLRGQYESAWALYSSLTDKGVRKEQARLVLPLASFTSFYMTINLRNLFHFLNLRVDSHAQFEARDLGEKMLSLVTAHFPVSTAVWSRYGRGPINGKTIQTP